MPADVDRPPGFRSWRGLYALVLGVFAATVALLAALSYVYR